METRSKLTYTGTKRGLLQSSWVLGSVATEAVSTGGKYRDLERLYCILKYYNNPGRGYLIQ